MSINCRAVRRASALFCLVSMGVGAHAQGINPGAAVENAFNSAVEARSRGSVNESIAQLEAILAQDTSLGRVRAELALAYFQAGNFPAALREIERLLADPTLPPTVRQNLITLRDTINAGVVSHAWSPSMSVSTGYDSNANFGPSIGTFQLPGGTLTLNQGGTARAASYLAASGGLTHRFFAADRVNLFGNPTNLIWQSQVSASTTQYANNLTAFNVNLLSASTGPQFFSTSGNWRASAAVQYDDITIGGTQLAGFTGVTPAFTWRSGVWEVSVDATLQQRRYNSANSARNSSFTTLGVAVSRSLGANAFAFVALRTQQEDAATTRFSNSGTETSVGAGYRVWLGGALTARFSERRTNYKGVEPLFNIARADTEQRTQLVLSHNFASGMLRNWTLSASYGSTRNRSSVGLFTYDRVQTAVTLSRSF